MTTQLLKRLADEHLNELRLEAERYRALPRHSAGPGPLARFSGSLGIGPSLRRPAAVRGGPAGCCA